MSLVTRALHVFQVEPMGMKSGLSTGFRGMKSTSDRQRPILSTSASDLVSNGGVFDLVIGRQQHRFAQDQ